MSLPQDILYIIFDFSQEKTTLSQVCKDFRKEFLPYKIASKKIERWYHNNRPFNPNKANDIGYDVKDKGTPKEWIRSLTLFQSEHVYLKCPEFFVWKLSLDENLLTHLPKLEERSKRDVRNWLFFINQPIEEYYYVGW